MTDFISANYPYPPVQWDPAWAAALLRAIEDAALLRFQATATDFTDGRESATGDRWLDGLPIWRRALPITQQFVENSGTSIAHEIASLGTVVRINGSFNSGGDRHPLPWFSVGGAMVLVRVSSTAIISALTGSPLFPSFVDGHVIIEYTKA